MPSNNIQVVSDHRGTFEPGFLTTLKLLVTDFLGDRTDPESISVTIQDESMVQVLSGIPEKIEEGFYIIDWSIDKDLPPGKYEVLWNYTINGQSMQEIQSVIVAATGDKKGLLSPFEQRVVDLRTALEVYISHVQRIPVYNEEGVIIEDQAKVLFNYPRWNQSLGTRLYRNQELITSDIKVDYFNGTVYFDDPITKYDTITAKYNFRWFKDSDLDRFLQDAMHTVNSYPPVTFNQTLFNFDNRFIPHVLYGASINAIRSLVMDLQFQEPQEVFGGPERAERAVSNFQALKQNYEEMFNGLLEQKKKGPYAGLQRIVSTPEFTLPGGRSRWFRMAFGSGV